MKDVYDMIFFCHFILPVLTPYQDLWARDVILKACRVQSPMSRGQVLEARVYPGVELNG